MAAKPEQSEEPVISEPDADGDTEASMSLWACQLFSMVAGRKLVVCCGSCTVAAKPEQSKAPVISEPDADGDTEVSSTALWTALQGTAQLP